MADIISFSLPSQMTKEIDSFAKLSHQTRSEFVRAAILDRLENQLALRNPRFKARIKKARSQMQAGTTRSLKDVAKRYGL